MKTRKWLNLRFEVIHPDGSRVTNSQLVARLRAALDKAQANQPMDFEIVSVVRAEPSPRKQEVRA